MAKILLAEDDKGIQDVYSRALKAKGHEVEVTENGEEALKSVSLAKPDIILMDIMMPRMDGLTALKKLKQDENTKSIPVLILTNINSTSLQTAKSSLDLGAADYIIKADTSIGDVIKLVEKYLQ